MELLVLLFNTAVVSALLYIPYLVILRKLTFFQLNRWYLLSIVPVSALMAAFPPTLFSTRSIVAISAFDGSQEFLNSASNFSSSTIADTSHVEWWQVILWIYVVGLAYSLFKSIQGIVALRKLAARSKESKEYPESGFKTFRTPKLQNPFSFFNWLFLPVGLEEAQLRVVIAHEQLHLKYHHSLDRLVHELWKGLFWFNPIVYLMSQSIRHNHEYQVDAHIIKDRFSITEYLQSIASFTYHKPGSMAVNTFKTKNIKKRIQMMNKRKSSLKSLWIYFLALPLAVIVSLAFVVQSEDHTPSIKPIKNVDVTSGFGMRKNPLNSEMKLHGGVDLRAKLGTPVVATAKGTVTTAKDQNNWGNLIIIKHGDTYDTWYAHLQDIQVEEGDIVEQGTQIGTVGNTGRSLGPHLHYEIRKNGERVNPEPYLGE